MCRYQCISSSKVSCLASLQHEATEKLIQVKEILQTFCIAQITGGTQLFPSQTNISRIRKSHSSFAVKKKREEREGCKGTEAKFFSLQKHHLLLISASCP